MRKRKPEHDLDETVLEVAKERCRAYYYRMSLSPRQLEIMALGYALGSWDQNKPIFFNLPSPVEYGDEIELPQVAARESGEVLSVRVEECEPDGELFRCAGRIV